MTHIPMNVANDNAPLTDEQRVYMRANVELKCAELLHALGIEYTEDPQTRDTPSRMAKMFVTEVFRGRYDDKPDLAVFPNTKGLNELYLTGPITVRSACSHHFVPIIGHAWVGVLPGAKLIGLSKINRLVDWVARRPQIQEEMSVQIADALEEAIRPQGIAVVVRATHMCMTWRGVEEPQNAQMVTSVMRGAFDNDAILRNEFLTLIGK
jgi:GTP cyclohydrolase IA